jgi:hypothetical protein
MALTEKELEAIKAESRRQKTTGEKAGRKWAEQVATIRDLERIHDTSAELLEGSNVLTKALRMGKAEVQAFCFADQPWCEAFADGFVWGAMMYLEEVDDGTFFEN